MTTDLLSKGAAELFSSLCMALPRLSNHLLRQFSRGLRVSSHFMTFLKSGPLMILSRCQIPSSPPSAWIPNESLRSYATLPVLLRDYQMECIQSVVSAIKHGHKRVGISLATGGGKTVVFTRLIEHIDPPSETATQTLIIAHRRELVEQAARHCTAAYPDKTIEIDMGGTHASGLAEITIASVMSLQKDERLEKYNPKHFKLVLVDEAHHIVAAGYRKILAHFGLSTKNTDSPTLVGVSATFSRFDGQRLGAAIDEIVYHKDYVDMVDEKWLSGVVFTTVRSTADISKVRTHNGGGGDFVISDLSRAVNTDQLNEVTVRSWLAKAAQRKSTLVFCVDLGHVAGLTQKFRQHGLDARFVTSETNRVRRGEILDAFRRQEFPILLNCGVFTEGTDIPNIDCVLLARPTRSRNLLVQMIGRGMRLHQGKKDCHVIDMVSSLETGIVTVPTLFGLDPEVLLSDKSIDYIKTTKERAQDEDLRQKLAYGEAGPEEMSRHMKQNITFTDYETIFDLLSDTSGERHINALSLYAWVQVGHNKYILSGDKHMYLRIVKDTVSGSDSDPLYWRVTVTRALPAGAYKSPWAPPEEISKTTTFADAVHGADKFAQKAFVHRLIARKEPWRDGPPTEGQLKFLNKVRSGTAKELTADDVTKGKAGDMITKIVHGAKGRFNRMQVLKRRCERQELKRERIRMQRQREVVKVGPLPA